MGKRVVVIASGETERRVLPHLLRPLAAEGIEIYEVRTPPRSRSITVEMAVQLIRSVWFDLMPRGQAPQKIVVLVDADRKSVEETLAPLAGPIAERVKDLPVPVLVSAAKWHLEAWFFADSNGLRRWLGRDLGSVDPSKPDEIENPKLHLKNLLHDRGPYLASTAEEIAQSLDVREIRRSPSFVRFEEAIRNGGRSQGP